MKTTITVDKSVARMLNLVKIHKGFRTINDVIREGLKNMDKKDISGRGINLKSLDFKKTKIGDLQKIEEEMKKESEVNKE